MVVLPGRERCADAMRLLGWDPGGRRALTSNVGEVVRVREDRRAPATPARAARVHRAPELWTNRRPQRERPSTGTNERGRAGPGRLQPGGLRPARGNPRPAVPGAAGRPRGPKRPLRGGSQTSSRVHSRRHPKSTGTRSLSLSARMVSSWTGYVLTHIWEAAVRYSPSFPGFSRRSCTVSVYWADTITFRHPSRGARERFGNLSKPGTLPRSRISTGARAAIRVSPMPSSRTCAITQAHGQGSSRVIWKPSPEARRRAARDVHGRPMVVPSMRRARHDSGNRRALRGRASPGDALLCRDG